MLFGVCRSLLFVVSCMFVFVCRLLFRVSCFVLSGRCLLFVGRRSLLIVVCLLVVDCILLFVVALLLLCCLFCL